MRTRLAFIFIYMASLGFMLYYNLTHPIVNDGVYEYQNFLLNIQDSWKFRYSSVNSSLISTWLPALIYKATSWDTFRIIPPFFYALMPTFVFLIAKKYLSFKYALMSVLVVILSSYIVFFPDVGRVGIALGLMSGMVWALLGKRLGWSISFAILLVFAHYATAVIAIGLVFSVVIASMIFKRKLLPRYVATALVLIILTGAWHFGIAKYSGQSMVKTMSDPKMAMGITNPKPGKEYPLDDVPTDIFVLESRDAVTQQAFGLNFGDNPTPAKMEIIINWVIVVFISFGTLMLLRKKRIDFNLKVMAFALYGLTVATVLLPPLSIFYGMQRVYFTSLMVLAVSFPLGIQWVSRRIKVSPVVISGVILAIYGLCTSGIMYKVFGLEKILPVVVSLK